MTGSGSAPRALRACALAIGAWTVLIALFAMHGLPMQQPGAMAMSTSAVAASSMSMPGPDVAGSHAGSTPEQACAGSDHCTATLRPVDTAAVPRVITVHSATIDMGRALSSRPAATTTARPPDLDTLQISRT